jgi:hypothetical protein
VPCLDEVSSGKVPRFTLSALSILAVQDITTTEAELKCFTGGFNDATYGLNDATPGAG